MKKKYITPAAVIVEVQNCCIICQSNPHVQYTLGNGGFSLGGSSGDGDAEDYEGDIR